MGIENLDKIFDPSSVAVIGASDRENSVGFRLLKNLVGVGFKGVVYPVNPKRSSVQGIEAYPSVDKLPRRVDLAVVATPAQTVPDIVEECGRADIPGVIIISAGFREIGTEGKILEDKLLEKKKEYNIRIVGPNSLGVMRPSISLNASFANKIAKPGDIAFISQSGALGASILDWSIRKNVGFSNFVSVGTMLDVDFGDLVDYFGTDPKTRSIILYIEAITDAQKFMSAARHFARTKPIIVIKSGKFHESAKAAASHTGALTGEDAIYDAAFRRAGIIRVDEIAAFFNCSEALAMQPRPTGPNLVIITNAGGPGVMATDALISKGGKLAPLSEETHSALKEALPPYRRVSNPIDIGEDATTERFQEVVGICIKDENVDGLIVIYSPQGASDAVATAKVVSELSKKTQKTILTSWMGEEDVGEARNLLMRNSVPTYYTPEQAISTFMYMYEYAQNLDLLYETPEELPDHSRYIPREIIQTFLLCPFRNITHDDRDILTEPESKKLLELYDIPTAKSYVAKTAGDASNIASRIGFPVVMKILSSQILHKTDAGGVALNIKSESEVREHFERIVNRAKEHNPHAVIEGVTVQPMISKPGYELIIGSKKDPVFGPVILFGMGGVGVELFKDVSIGFPPLDQVLVRRMMEDTQIYKLLVGYRNMPKANLKLVEEILVRFSRLIADFPEIKEADINPLFVNENEAIALDARILIDRSLFFSEEPSKPYQHLIIRPYPKRYETRWNMRDGRSVLIRPVKPEDEPLILELFESFSEDTMRYRFFKVIKEMPHDFLIRFCNIDYDREIGIVAELTENGRKRLIGVVGLYIEPNKKRAEFAVAVGDPWQRHGLGSKLMDYIIEIGKDKEIEAIYGEMMRENYKVIKLLEKKGFIIEHRRGENSKASLKLS